MIGRLWALCAVVACVASAVTVRAAPVTIVVWHGYSGAEKEALEEVSASFARAHPDVRLSLVPMPFTVLLDEVAAANRQGRGPDLFICGHDCIGDFAAQRTIQPVGPWVTAALKKRYAPAALEALTYDRAVYGLPTCLKSVVLIYNRKLVKSPPRDTAEMVELAKGLTDVKANRYGLAYEIHQTYQNAAWLFGHGGGFFDRRGRPDLCSAANTSALTFISDLYGKHGIMPRDTTNTNVCELFGHGQAAMVISGSWFLDQIDRSVDVGLAPLPAVKGCAAIPTPFLTVETIQLTTSSRHKPEAFEVMKYLTGEDAARVMASRAKQAVANVQAYRAPAIDRDPHVRFFRQQAERAVIMPNSPAMRAIWQPLDGAIVKALKRVVRPKEALAQAQAKVLESLRVTTK